MMKRLSVLVMLMFIGAWPTLETIALGFDEPKKNITTTAERQSDKPDESSDKLVPLNKMGTVLLDVQGKRVLLKTMVVLREGLLEMLVCKKQTKEHESILSVDAQAYAIHAGLVAIGAESGNTAGFDTEFRPPTGQRIDIFVQWKDKDGRLQRVPAQNWVRYVSHRFYAAPLKRMPPDLAIPEDSELYYDKKNHELSWYGPMTAAQREKLLSLSQDKMYRRAILSYFRRSQPRQMGTYWVFAGSILKVDPTTDKNLYYAEGGDVICVANFPTAMIDVAGESTSSGESNLLFEPYTERIPPLDTEVTVELIPRFKKTRVENPRTSGPGASAREVPDK